MKKSIQLCSALILTASISSCATQKFIIADKAVSRKADSERFSHFFISGIGQTDRIDASRICKGKEVSHVEAHWSFVDILLATVTLNIYSPRTASVYCKK
jgi:hypothetical protein